MYFTVNTAIVNYLDNLNETLQFPILLNWTTLEQTLPISLQSFDFNLDFLKALKDFAHQFWHKKEIFDLQERNNNGLDLANKNSFFNNYAIDICSVYYYYNLIICQVTCMIFRHTKLRSLVISLAL